MTNAFTTLNLWAILAATVASFGLGGLWFTVFFGKSYAKALNRPYDAKAKPAPIYMVGPLVCGLVTTLTSAILISALRITTLAEAIAFGILIGFGYLAATTVNTAINPNMPRPLFYGVISGAYFTLSGVVVSVILVAMG